jgi:hypothetical protein
MYAILEAVVVLKIHILAFYPDKGNSIFLRNVATDALVYAYMVK